MSDPQSNPVEDFIDYDEEERAENQRLMERLRLNRPKHQPMTDAELKELLRTMPKRRSRVSRGT